MAASGVAFGTSGARGTVEAMTNPVCYAYTQAFLQAMSADGVIQAGSSVLLAGDLSAAGAGNAATADAGPVEQLPTRAVAYLLGLLPRC